MAVVQNPTISGIPIITNGKSNSIVIVSDSTGADGFNPAQSVQQQIFDSVAWWAAAYSKGALSIGSTCSIGGWSTTDVDLYWNSRVASKQTKFVILGIGLNDIYGATDVTVASVESNLRLWYEKKVREVLSWGGVPIVQTTFPCGTSYFSSTTVKRTAAFNHNKWRRALAAKLGVPLLDAEALMIDPSSATAEPYTAYMQPSGSPHAGKEFIRTLGELLWTNSLSKLVASNNEEQVNQYSTNQLFTNPGFSGTGGNINGGNGASVLPDSVWGWSTGTHTTYSIVASTDSKFNFAGAPVKSPWVNVSTDTSLLPTAPNGVASSSAQPGLLFFSSGLNLAIGDVVKARVEIDVITPNTLIGFDISLFISGGTETLTAPNSSSSFTPTVNADNSKNHILTPTTITVPELSVTSTAAYTGVGVWLTINPKFSGISGATGASVWRVRNVKVFKE